MIRRFLVAAAVTAASLCSISVPAHADVITDGPGSISVLSGNQVIVPVNVDVLISDVAAALLGHASVNH